MADGEPQVRDVGDVAGEANAALGAMLGGIERIAAAIGDAARRRAQQRSMGGLAGPSTS